MRFWVGGFAAAMLLTSILAGCSAAAQTAPTSFGVAPSTPLHNDSPEVVELLKKASAAIKGQGIYDCIQEITASPYAYRLMGSPNRDLFVEKHAKVFSGISPRIKDHVMEFKQGSLPAGVGPQAPTGKNIIGVLPGRDLTKWVVIGGHYDTQAPTTGAIDNTSGTCVVKEIAKAVIAIDLQPEVTLVFAWWDGEEWGLYGSKAFVKDHSQTAKLLGVEPEAVKILVGESFDIVGINYPAYNTWVGYGQQARIVDEYALLNLRMAPSDEAFMKGMYGALAGRDDKDQIILNNSRYEGLVKEINHELLELPVPLANVHQDNYGRSDQVPFIAAGIPGMRIQGSHDYQEWPYYHTPADTLASAAVMAGGLDKLLAGFDTAAEAGGLTAIYVAHTGGYGEYSNKTTEPVAEDAARDLAGSPRDTSGPVAPLAIVCLVAAVLIGRRTRG